MNSHGPKKWFVLKVEGGREVKVASDLCEQGYEAYVPKAFDRQVIGRQAFPIPRPKWSPYVFVAVDPVRRQSCGIVRDTLHVIDFVSLTPTDDPDVGRVLNPSEIPAAMVLGLQMDENIDWLEASKPPSRARKCSYSEGDIVRVVEIGHPYESWEGRVKDARPGSVNIELGPNHFPVRVEEDHIMLVTAFQARTAAREPARAA